MECKVYWIDRSPGSSLGTAARPRGGDWLEDELRSLRNQGVELLVSLLTPEEVDELALSNEAALCRNLDIEYRNFPIPDRTVPADRHGMAVFVQSLHRSRLAGRTMVAHCRGGIGRASVLAACLMYQAGVEVSVAFQQIAAARGCAVPDTPEQRIWTEAFCTSLQIPK